MASFVNRASLSATARDDAFLIANPPQFLNPILHNAGRFQPYQAGHVRAYMSAASLTVVHSSTWRQLTGILSGRWLASLLEARRSLSQRSYIEIIVMSGTNRLRAVDRQIARVVLRQACPFVGHLLEGYGGLYHAEREARFEGEATE